MHTKKFGREATEAVLAKVYTSPTEFTKDVDAVSLRLSWLPEC